MDIYRKFDLDIVETKEENFTTLKKVSSYEGEYGNVTLVISCDLDSRFPSFHATFSEISAENYRNLHPFMENEILQFLRLLPMFHPITRLKDEIPQSSAQES